MGRHPRFRVINIVKHFILCLVTSSRRKSLLCRTFLLLRGSLFLPTNNWYSIYHIFKRWKVCFELLHLGRRIRGNTSSEACSSLLSNLYARRFISWWRLSGIISQYRDGWPLRLSSLRHNWNLFVEKLIVFDAINTVNWVYFRNVVLLEIPWCRTIKITGTCVFSKTLQTTLPGQSILKTVLLFVYGGLLWKQLACRWLSHLFFQNHIDSLLAFH